MNDQTCNYQYDLAIIGGGPGGYESALEAARLGMKTLLIERDALGGTCLNRGCIPTKTLLYWAEICRQAAELPGDLPQALNPGSAAFISALMDRKDQVVSQLQGGIRSLLKSAKVEVVQGHGSILGPGKVCIRDMAERGPDSFADSGRERMVTARSILIATGSVPGVPPIPGRDLPGVLTSDGLLSCREPIGSLTIIGGGVIGMEFASIYSAFGCEVTVIEAMERILPTMEREFSQNLRMILKKRGLRIETGASVEEIRALPEGLLSCCLKQKDQEFEASSEKILIATGRKACTYGLIHEKAEPEVKAMAMDRGFIKVNDHFETSVPGIYAIGDVNGRLQLAHAAAAQGKWAVAAAKNRLGGSCPAVLPDLNFVPSCVYTDPEIASVGLTADEAKARGMDAKTYKYPMSANGKSVLTGQERGFIKLVASKESGRLLGAQMMCARASDLISFFTEALTAGLTIGQLQKAIFPHPTFSEGIGEALRLYP